MSDFAREMRSRPIIWNFPTIPPFKNYGFERLTRENSERCWEMFRDDENPFLDEYFTDRDEFLSYISSLCDYMPRSVKRGGADWLVTQSGSNVGASFSKNNDIAILHCYDLSLEPFEYNDISCTIGFATAAPFRRQGVMRDIVPHFVQYLARELGRTRILAYTKQANIPSQNLLKSLDFMTVNEEFVGSERNVYFRFYAQPVAMK
ncbi:MAG: GNAT family N-acetyltransferase [Candidatus Kapabacteria bacterium]|nr:GNAT family N-acetyltransferase [Candidatus Kapabacteria bacterium]